MTEDAELLRRYVADRSEQAFADLVRRHIDLVYNSALRRLNGDEHAARDVTQQVFTDLSRKAPTFGPETVLAGWLYTSARFAAAKRVRSEVRRRAREMEATTMQEIESSASVPWEDLRPVIDEALDELKPQDREAVLLRYFDGRPLAAVGKTLAVSEDAARMRVDRALDKLRAALERRGVTSTGAALATVLAAQPIVAAPAGLIAAVTKAALTVTAVGVAPILGAKALLILAVALAAGLSWFFLREPAPPPAPAGGRESGAAAIPLLQGPVAVFDGNEALAVGAPTTAEAEAPVGTLSRSELLVRARGRLNLYYAQLFRSLDLPPLEQRRFEDLLVQKQSILSDVIAREGPPPSGVEQRGAYFARVVEAQSEVDAGIAQVLGEQLAALYLDYEYKIVARLTVNAFRMKLRAIEPLSPEQANRLYTLLVRSVENGSSRSTAGLSLETMGGTGGRPFLILGDSELTRAKTFLSPAQWTFLQVNYGEDSVPDR